jgi:hypothetical protein
MTPSPNRQRTELLSRRDRERDAVIAWRAERLVSLGVRSALALELAETVDWHELADLLARGCPPDLALEILR